jgi:hypothetical protein
VRTLTGIAVACCALFAANCSGVPTLEEATGTTEPPPLFVNDVVLRVKCESIQPNWTLIVLNGPLTQLANAQGIRTHTLLIAIGPEDENKTNIQNATVTNSAALH